jgi:hypothetical protein
MLLVGDSLIFYVSFAEPYYCLARKCFHKFNKRIFDILSVKKAESLIQPSIMAHIFYGTTKKEFIATISQRRSGARA